MLSEGQALSGRREDRVRAGAQLLFLPGGLRGLPHRRLPGGGGLIQICLFLSFQVKREPRAERMPALTMDRGMAPSAVSYRFGFGAGKQEVYKQTDKQTKTEENQA